MDPSDRLVFWEGETFDLAPGVTLINLGGHFPGSTALHWARTSDGRGVLISGDTIKPVMDRRYVGFMYSIVNLIPMGPAAVKEIVRRLEPFEFDRVYSLWSGHIGSERRQGGDQTLGRTSPRSYPAMTSVIPCG